MAAIVNNATGGRNDSGSYRIPVAVQFLWAIIICVGLLFLPETPRFLIKQDKHDKVHLSARKGVPESTKTFKGRERPKQTPSPPARSPVA